MKLRRILLQQTIKGQYIYANQLDFVVDDDFDIKEIERMIFVQEISGRGGL